MAKTIKKVISKRIELIKSLKGSSKTWTELLKVYNGDKATLAMNLKSLIGLKYVKKKDKKYTLITTKTIEKIVVEMIFYGAT